MVREIRSAWPKKKKNTGTNSLVNIQTSGEKTLRKIQRRNREMQIFTTFKQPFTFNQRDEIF